MVPEHSQYRRLSGLATAQLLRKLEFCLGFGLGLAACPLAAQQATDCEFVNAPVNTSFDFTQDLSRWGTETDFDLDSTPYSVRSIHISQLPIFDQSNPRENNDLYRWINGVHFNTRTEVIREQLLFDNQDIITSDLMKESERILRNQKYVADARLRVLEKCGDSLDLEVVTREVWTLTPEIDFKSKGGDNTGSLGIRDANFLGSGQQMSLVYKNDVDRNSYEFAYKAPNFKGSRVVVDAGATTSTDGHRLFGHVGLPFYSMDSTHSWDLSAESIDAVLNQYSLGHRVSQVQHQSTMADFAWGFSGAREPGHMVQRYSAGLRHEQHDYLPATDLPPPALLPDDLTLTYPFVRYEAIEDNYVVAYNISQIMRSEDLHVGKHFIATLGYAPDNSGHLVFNGSYADTLLYRPRHLLQVHADWDGRWNKDTGSWQDTVLHMNLDFHRGQTANRTLFMGLAATRALGLNPARQVTLGGSSGLRGYDNHLLNGDTSLTFTVEERLFTDYHLLQLLRVGIAAFVDIGKIYGDPDPRTNDIFKDVGFGLRLAPSKSEQGQVIHMDFAWPVGSPLQEAQGMKFYLEVKRSF